MANQINQLNLPEYPERPNNRDKRLYQSVKEDKNIKDTFESAPIVSRTDNTDGSEATGATGETIGFQTKDGQYELYMAATSSTQTAAVAAVYSLECRADSGDDLDGTWFALYTPTAPIVFWYDTDDSGTTVPSHGLAGAVEVEITTVATNDTAADVATKTEVLIEANGFSSSVNTATITITADESGYTRGVNAGTSAHTSLSVTTEGENELEGVFKAPYVSSDGLELTVSSAGDALEITNGTTSRARQTFTVGQANFYFKTTFKIDDISDVTELFAGLRKVEAYQADPDNYDEMAAFNIGKDADGQLEIHTILNGASPSETDTTETDWANGGEHTLQINVDRDGTCTFRYDNEEPTVTATFKFDDGEVLMPFLHMNTETGDPGTSISLWEAGYAEDYSTP